MLPGCLQADARAQGGRDHQYRVELRYHRRRRADGLRRFEAAVIAFTEVTGVGDTAPHGVRVNAIAPDSRQLRG